MEEFSITSNEFKKIAIIGLGFMGIALAKSLKQLDQGIIINGYDISNDLLNCLQDKNIINNKYNDLIKLTKDSDIIFLTTPTDCFRGIIQDICSVVDKQIIVDFGSIKTTVYDDISGTLPENKKELYVPLHPICGGPSIKKENNLYKEIDRVPQNLFKDKLVHFFPKNTNEQNMSKVQNIFIKLNSVINTKLDINEHDKVYALTSHLPMFLVIVFLLSIKNEKDKTYEYFSDKILDKMWLPIFIDNIDNIDYWLKQISQDLPKQITTANLSLLLQKITNDNNLSNYVGNGYKTFVDCKNSNVCVNKEDFERYKNYLLHLCKEQNIENRLFALLSELNKKILNTGQNFYNALNTLDELINKEGVLEKYE